MQAVFPCLVELWESPQLAKLNPKVVELLIATVKHLYSNEKLVANKVAEFFKISGAAAAKTPAATTTTAAAKPTTSGPPEASTDGASAPPPPPPPAPPVHPSVDPMFLQQLCDMGFTRDHAEEALMACANDITAAMDWILNHPPSTSTSAAPVSLLGIGGVGG